MTKHDKFKLAVNVIALLLVLTANMRGFCVNSDVAMHAMANEGYSNVRIQRRSNIFTGFNGCSSTDAVAFEVDAQNATGQYVSVNVCCGYPFMGCLIRH